MSDTATKLNGASVEIESFTQTRWRCPSCRKSWSKRSDARDHIEKGCYGDPDTRSCKTCTHYNPGSPSELIDGLYMDPGVPAYCAVDAAEDIDLGIIEIMCNSWVSHKSDYPREVK